MTRIGPYTVESVIGHGGMGVVYRGRDPRFDRPVAIKVLHEQYQHDAQLLDRFRSEAVIQAKLSHPNIVSVIDFVVESDLCAMVLEFVDGVPVSDLLQSGRPVEQERAVALIDQVLSALGYAHARGLVHRDVKPSNILVVRYGQDEIAKVADFGIAKVLGSEKVRTATGAKMGTLAYMSPEQIVSPRDVDARADVYSTGVVLYELLTGRVPFDADTEYGLMQQIIEQPVRGFSGLDPVMAEVLQRAMAKKPGERFETVEAFREALRAPVLERAGYQTASGRAVAPAVTPVVRETAAECSAESHDQPSEPSVGEPKARKRLLIGAAVAVGIAGWMAFSYITDPYRLTVARIVAGQLVLPEGESARDSYRRLVADGMGNADARRATVLAKEAVSSRVEHLVLRLRNQAEESQEGWREGLLLLAWDEELSLPGNSNRRRSRAAFFEGRLKLLQQDYAGAQAALEQAMRLDGNWALPVNSLGRLHIRIGDRPTAQALYRRAAELDPEWIFPWMNLAQLSVDLRDYSTAETAVQAALRLDRNRPTAHYFSARVLEETARPCEAVRAYANALRLAAGQAEPGFATTAAARRREALMARHRCAA